MEPLAFWSELMRSRAGLKDYSLQILPTVDETTSNFPQQFGIFKNDEMINLEAFFDDLLF